MTAKEILQLLKDEFWVKKISLVTFPFISKMSTPPVFKLHKEVTIRLETDELTRFGKPKPQRRRFDAIALIKPYYSAYGNDLLSVGIEIKVSKNDLKNDAKYVDYLGYTDFFFFVVPSELVPIALEKSTSDFVGVIDIQTKEIIKMPNRQTVNIDNAEKIFRQISFSNL